MVCLLPLVLVAIAAGPSTPVHEHVTTLLLPPAVDLLRSESRRVRAADARAAKLLEQGMRRSRTFAAMMAALQRTDVIVYVETRRQLPARMGGRLLFQGVAAHDRYLRVQVLETLREKDAIEILAHELRHALEVADDPRVVDDATMAALYRRIGYSRLGGHTYDTDAARLAGYVVRRELGG